eukprot:93988-Pyramimonas_sp.AAC.1
MSVVGGFVPGSTYIPTSRRRLGVQASFWACSGATWGRQGLVRSPWLGHLGPGLLPPAPDVGVP